jgi:hypothetical protein
MVLVGVTAEAQELVPDAYTPAPVGLNVIVFAGAFGEGDLAFDPSLPIEQASAKIGGPGLAFARALGLAGRSATITVTQPYIVGHLQGFVLKQFQQTSRSGLGDPMVRVGVNLFGAPAMTPRQFAAYRPKVNVGASITVVMPLGQYYSDKLVNLGSNRWGFKPEVGITRTWGKWRAEWYMGAWLYTDNTDFYGGSTRHQAPIASGQAHLTYTIRPRTWVALDGNFWNGGGVSVNGGTPTEQQRNSRIGTTVALPINQKQTIKVAYSFGAYTTVGGDFNSVGVSYTYGWLSGK